MKRNGYDNFCFGCLFRWWRKNGENYQEAFNKLEEGMTIEEVKDINIVGGELREILGQMKLRECRGSCLDDPTGSVIYLYWAN